MGIIDNKFERNEFLNALVPKLASKNIDIILNDGRTEISIYSKIDGVFKVNIANVLKINAFSIFSLITIYNNSEIKKGTLVAKITNITSPKKKSVDVILDIIGNNLLDVLPFNTYKAALVTIGDTFFNNEKKEPFSDILESKISKFNNSYIIYKEISSEDIKSIISSIKRALSCSDILFIGIDAKEDKTVIDNFIDELKLNSIPFKIPLYPGNDTVLFYMSNKPVIILSKDLFKCKITALDIILSRIFIGEILTPEELLRFSVGGVCYFCNICIYPICPFGKY